MKIIHNKLIRDNIPEIIERDNKTCKVRVLDDAEYLACLKDKLLEEGNEVTHAIGSLFNHLEDFLNHIIWRKHPHHKDFEHALVLRYEGFKENLGMISRSLSYGLLLFSLGLCATLIYLLLSML